MDEKTKVEEIYSGQEQVSTARGQRSGGTQIEPNEGIPKKSRASNRKNKVQPGIVQQTDDPYQLDKRGCFQMVDISSQRPLSTQSSNFAAEGGDKSPRSSQQASQRQASGALPSIEKDEQQKLTRDEVENAQKQRSLKRKYQQEETNATNTTSGLRSSQASTQMAEAKVGGHMREVQINQAQQRDYYYQPKGLVRTVNTGALSGNMREVNVGANGPTQGTAGKKKKKTRSNEAVMAQGSGVDDQGILDMVKPLTVQNLNVMFQEKQDIFEYPNDKPDWKYPKHVKIAKTKRYRAQDIQDYNETHVTKQNIKYDAINDLYDDDEQYFVKNQMQKNATDIIKKGNEDIEKQEIPFNSSVWLSAMQMQGSLTSVIALLCSLVYFVHFNFASSLLRLVYFIFVCLYPGICLAVNIVIATNLKNLVLKGEHNNPINAEFLDFEDTEEDIVRKAKILAVQRRLNLQLYAMTPLFISGFYKVISEKDFPMQIYCAYIIELCTMSLPILILQVINNALLESWRPTTFFSMVVLSINLITDLRGIIAIGDKMTQDQNEILRKQAYKKHQRDKQLLLAKHQRSQMPYEEEDDFSDDIWKSSSFSSQRTFQTSRNIAAFSMICIILVVGCTLIPQFQFQEQCSKGYYQEKASNAPIAFINENICGRCETQYCSLCQNTQGKVCDLCLEGYFKRQESGQCIECEFEGGNCLACENNRICTKCAANTALRKYNGEDGEPSTKCVTCPTTDGCDTCGNNKCLTCLPGYFLTDDGTCHECQAAQDGCEKCDNMYTCQECSPVGFLLDPTTNQCKCDEAEGFSWNKQKMKCECSGQTYNADIIPQTDDAPIKYTYNNQQKCINCKEMFHMCDSCVSSPVYMSGARQFKDRDTGGSLHVMCSSCWYGYYYDTSIAACNPCWALHGDACTACSQNGCQTCLPGFYLVDQYCVGCKNKFDYCDACSYSDCNTCEKPHLLVSGSCW